ncbi:MAG: hypothetical protein J6C88_07205 [Lachnospiraceae bacterium]|nr:hypothetical protein [Lachnospiraceae bacterium]
MESEAITEYVKSISEMQRKWHKIQGRSPFSWIDIKRKGDVVNEETSDKTWGKTVTGCHACNYAGA